MKTYTARKEDLLFVINSAQVISCEAALHLIALVNILNYHYTLDFFPAYGGFTSLQYSIYGSEAAQRHIRKMAVLNIFGNDLNPKDIHFYNLDIRENPQYVPNMNFRYHVNYKEYHEHWKSSLCPMPRNPVALLIPVKSVFYVESLISYLRIFCMGQATLYIVQGKPTQEAFCEAANTALNYQNTKYVFITAMDHILPKNIFVRLISVISKGVLDAVGGVTPQHYDARPSVLCPLHPQATPDIDLDWASNLRNIIVSWHFLLDLQKSYDVVENLYSALILVCASDLRDITPEKAFINVKDNLKSGNQEFALHNELRMRGKHVGIDLLSPIIHLVDERLGEAKGIYDRPQNFEKEAVNSASHLPPAPFRDDPLNILEYDCYFNRLQNMNTFYTSIKAKNKNLLIERE